MAVLSAQDLTLKYDQRCVVDGLTAEIPEGKVTMIVGANACGKSTLLRGLSRLLKPAAGTVTLDGKDIHARPARELARTLGLLPQHPTAPDGIAVRDLVGRGRYPHQGFFRSWRTKDDAAVQRALEATETLELAERNVDELSGGQRQRVWIAMALAQETEVLLLDEPTTYLDLAHQVEVLDLVTDLNRQRGTTVAIVLHDLNLAARYADHVIAMKGGEIVAEGASTDVVTEELVRDVFGLESRVVPDPVSGTPLIIPLGRHHAAANRTGDRLMSTAKHSPAARPDRSPRRLRAGRRREASAATEPMTLAFDVTVSSVQELSPNFRRITFGGYSLRDFGVHGDTLDLRVKLMIPSLAPDGTRLPLPVFEMEQTGWYQEWLAMDPATPRLHAHLHGPAVPARCRLSGDRRRLRDALRRRRPRRSRRELGTERQAG